MSSNHSTVSTPGDTSQTSASTPASMVSLPTTKLQANQIAPTPENILKFTSIISAAFHSTPLTTIFIAEIDAKSAPSADVTASSTASVNPKILAHPPFDHARRTRHFLPGITSAAESGAILVEAGNWSAIALWEPPHFQGEAFVEARNTPREIFTQWRTAVRRMKATYLADPAPGAEPGTVRPFYHLSFLARNPHTETVGPLNEQHEHVTPSVPGAISALLVPFLLRARAEGVPAWLEATNLHAVDVYQHLGFRVCEEVIVGQGECDERGYPCQGEEACGVKAWGMIFDEHLR